MPRDAARALDLLAARTPRTPSTSTSTTARSPSGTTDPGHRARRPTSARSSPGCDPGDAARIRDQTSGRAPASAAPVGVGRCGRPSDADGLDERDVAPSEGRTRGWPRCAAGPRNVPQPVSIVLAQATASGPAHVPRRRPRPGHRPVGQDVADGLERPRRRPPRSSRSTAARRGCASARGSAPPTTNSARSSGSAGGGLCGSPEPDQTATSRARRGRPPLGGRRSGPRPGARPSSSPGRGDRPSADDVDEARRGRALDEALALEAKRQDVPPGRLRRAGTRSISARRDDAAVPDSRCHGRSAAAPSGPMRDTVARRTTTAGPIRPRDPEERPVAKVTMPQLGESVAEGTIGKWLKQPGDTRREVRAAPRGHHRQGQRRGPVAVRRRPEGDPRRGRRDGPEQRRDRGHRDGRRGRPTRSAEPTAPAAPPRAEAPRRQLAPAAPRRPTPAAAAPPRPAAGADRATSRPTARPAPTSARSAPRPARPPAPPPPRRPSRPRRPTRPATPTPG